MRFELQHIDDCPNWEVALERLREALVATGHGEDPVTVRAVRDPAEADRMGFAGSPSMYADGIELFPGADHGAQACRVYTTPSGLAGSPTVEQLVAAIRGRDAEARRDVPAATAVPDQTVTRTPATESSDPGTRA